MCHLSERLSSNRHVTKLPVIILLIKYLIEIYVFDIVLQNLEVHIQHNTDGAEHL